MLSIAANRFSRQIPLIEVEDDFELRKRELKSLVKVKAIPSSRSCYVPSRVRSLSSGD